MVVIIIPGSLSLVGTVPSTDNGTILGPLSTNGGPISPLLDNVLHHGVSSCVPNSLPSLVRVESGNQSNITESGHPRNHPKFELRSTPNLHPHSLPEYDDGLANGPPFGSPSNMAANINSRPPEIIDSQQFRRVSPNGQSIELNEGNDCQDLVSLSFICIFSKFLFCWLLTGYQIKYLG